MQLIYYEQITRTAENLRAKIHVADLHEKCATQSLHAHSAVAAVMWVFTAA